MAAVVLLYSPPDQDLFTLSFAVYSSTLQEPLEGLQVVDVKCIKSVGFHAATFSSIGRWKGTLVCLGANRTGYCSSWGFSGGFSRQIILIRTSYRTKCYTTVTICDYATIRIFHSTVSSFHIYLFVNIVCGILTVCSPISTKLSLNTNAVSTDLPRHSSGLISVTRLAYYT